MKSTSIFNNILWIALASILLANCDNENSAALKNTDNFADCNSDNLSADRGESDVGDGNSQIYADRGESDVGDGSSIFALASTNSNKTSSNKQPAIGEVQRESSNKSNAQDDNKSAEQTCL